MLKNKLLSAMGGAPANYIEDVFSTYLYTGNGSTQTITNGIDLAGKGGLVWLKPRNAPDNHVLWDTSRGATKGLISNNTDAEFTQASGLTSFGSTGFTVGTGQSLSSTTYASWTFREQPKFFDVVTYTGDGSARTIAHNLGSVPGCIIVKAYSGGTASSQNWPVYHTSLANTETLFLNLTDAKASVAAGYWNSTTPTSTEFSLGTANAVNQSGTLYVAYLFAHNAGGFGLTGTDNVISCGSFTTNGSSIATVDLGYEPQWILVKNVQEAGNNWFIWDTKRGWTADGTTGDFYLIPNLSDAEGGGADYGGPNATGFTIRNLQASNQFVYMAVRKNMKS